MTLRRRSSVSMTNGQFEHDCAILSDESSHSTSHAWARAGAAYRAASHVSATGCRRAARGAARPTACGHGARRSRCGQRATNRRQRQRKTDERRRLGVVADRVFGLAEQLTAVDPSRVERAAEGAMKSACTDQAALRVLRVHRDIHRDDLLFRFAALVAILAAAMLLFRSRPYEVVRNHHQDVVRRFVFGIDRAFGAPPLLFRARLLLAGACFCCVVGHKHAHGPIARDDLG